MTDLTKTNVKTLLKAIIADSEDAIEDTDYEDADITGYIEDEDNNTLEFDGSTYDYNW